MNTCSICKRNVDILYTCNRCGGPFCPDCGDLELLLCNDCLAEEW
jgi:predicted RNA-binding Zn-ribbon protein involved in translation (DUF1610 family)